MNVFTIIRTLAIVALTALIASPSLAHRSNESYVYFDVTDEALAGRFEAALSDLDGLLGIDTNGNALFEQEEIAAAEERIFELMDGRLSLMHDGKALGIEPTGIETLDTGHVGVFAQIGFRVVGLTPVPEEISVDYEPLTELLSNHGGFILIASNTRVGLADNEAYISLTFTEDDGPQMLSLVGEPRLKVFWEFVTHGIWHIWLGFDHVVFLLTLLLPAVMMPAGRSWIPTESFKGALWSVTKIVTVFTLSHSVTLTLAGLGILQLPSTLVEAVIAASIIIVALMNLAPSAHRYMLWVVFVFGLFHGFGFANVLAPLALDPTRQVIGLAAFNIGVELGQLAIVLVAFPVLWLVRKWRIYPFMAFKVGTVVLVILAGSWFLERTTSFEFNVRGTITMLTGIEL